MACSLAGEMKKTLLQSQDRHLLVLIQVSPWYLWNGYIVPKWSVQNEKTIVTVNILHKKYISV